jgi:hypothetical protein
MMRLSGLAKLMNSACGAKRFHLAHQIENERQRAQREEQPARTAILAKRMPDAVFARHCEVELP